MTEVRFREDLRHLKRILIEVQFMKIRDLIVLARQKERILDSVK